MRAIRLLSAILLIPAILFSALGVLPGAAQTPARAGKPAVASKSCDGALDIVPSGSMSFTRKRRPARPIDGKRAKPQDSR